MKRIMKIAFTMVLVMLLTGAFANGQEKKEKQHIKIVVSDKNGKEVVIDTTFSTAAIADSIKLKDGHVIYIGKEDGHATAHVSTDEAGKVIIIKSGGNHTGVKDGEIMTWVSADASADGKGVFYIHKGEPAVKDGEIRYNIEVKTDESGKKVEKTSYVVAKNGMVVTIEGDDEEKVKELAGVVEAKLGVSKDDKSGKEVVKEETKKTVKK